MIVEKVGLISARNAAHHDVAGLEISIEKVIAAGAQQKLRQAAEIVLQRLLIESNSSQSEEVVLEVIEIPRNRLPVKAGTRITHLVVQIAPGFDLKPRQKGNDVAIGRNRLGGDNPTVSMRRKKLKKRGVAQIFFEIGAMIQIFSVNLGHRQTVPAKVPGKFEESYILFAHVIENADGAVPVAGKTYDLSSRTAQLPLQRFRPGHRCVEMPLEECFQNFHESKFQHRTVSIKIPSASLKSAHPLPLQHRGLSGRFGGIRHWNHISMCATSQRGGKPRVTMGRLSDPVLAMHGIVRLGPEAPI